MKATASSLDLTVADMGTPVVCDQDSCLAGVVIAKEDQARGAFEVGAALGNLGWRRQGVEFTDEVIYHVLFPDLNRTRKGRRSSAAQPRRGVSTDQRTCRMTGHECVRVTRG